MTQTIAPHRAMATCVKQTASRLNREEAKYVITIEEHDGAEPFTVRTFRLLTSKSSRHPDVQACQSARDLSEAWELVAASLDYYGTEKTIVLRDQASGDATHPRRYVVHDPKTKKPKLVEGEQVIADFDPN